MRTTSTRPLFAFALALGTLAAQPAEARDKEHQQIAADVRMLQEQSQQLQNLLGQLGETMKAVNQRLDDQAKANVKAFADQKLIIDTLQRDLVVLREKMDDSNTRLGSVAQEVEALRQAMLTPVRTAAPFEGTDPSLSGGASPDGAPGVPQAGGAPAIAVGPSPNRLYDMAWSNYIAGLYDLANDGFQAFLRSFPKSDMADDAQVYIGNAYLLDGKNEKAIEAYDLAVRTYANGNAIPDAHYKKGLAHRNLKQIDQARQSWEFLIKSYPDSVAAALAKQALQQIAAPPGR